MTAYRLPGSNERIFYRQGRKMHLEELLAAEGLESISALLRTRPHRGVSLLVQYGVDRNGGPPGGEIGPPLISVTEANDLIDQALEAGCDEAELMLALGQQYTGTQKKVAADESAATGLSPTTTPTSP